MIEKKETKPKAAAPKRKDNKKTTKGKAANKKTGNKQKKWANDQVIC